MTKDLNKILETEYLPQFDEIRKRSMINSYYKYGPVKDNYENYKCLDALANLKLRIEKYEETGNKEFLCDAANFAMIEFMYPTHQTSHFNSTGTDACELAGFGVNQIKDY